MTDTIKYTPEDLRDVIIESLEENKAEDIVTIPLKGKSSIADFMIIASGRSSRHAVGLSNNIAESIAKSGMKKAKFEGKDNGDWVLGDAGDVIIHLFREEVREFYNIEKIWCDPELLEEYEAGRLKSRSEATSTLDA